jgi:hypothetical protein
LSVVMRAKGSPDSLARRSDLEENTIYCGRSTNWGGTSGTTTIVCI